MKKRKHYKYNWPLFRRFVVVKRSRGFPFHLLDLPGKKKKTFDERGVVLGIVNCSVELHGGTSFFKFILNFVRCHVFCAGCFGQIGVRVVRDVIGTSRRYSGRSTDSR